MKKNGALTEPHAYLWFTQSTQALRYVHEEVLIENRDIKVDNILLDENNNCKLTDFEFAKIFKKNSVENRIPFNFVLI